MDSSVSPAEFNKPSANYLKFMAAGCQGDQLELLSVDSQ